MLSLGQPVPLLQEDKETAAATITKKAKIFDLFITRIIWYKIVQS